MRALVCMCVCACVCAHTHVWCLPMPEANWCMPDRAGGERPWWPIVRLVEAAAGPLPNTGAASARSGRAHVVDLALCWSAQGSTWAGPPEGSQRLAQHQCALTPLMMCCICWDIMPCILPPTTSHLDVAAGQRAHGAKESKLMPEAALMTLPQNRYVCSSPGLPSRWR